MPKIKYFIALLFLSNFANSGTISWETLKTLSIDQKTKKPVVNSELKKFIGKEVTIKGFMMPLDYDSKAISEFLLMPYVPACMHVPPPPPNQLVLVKMNKGGKAAPTFYPIELTGKLILEVNPELESSYKIEGVKVKELKDEAPASVNPN